MTILYRFHKALSVGIISVSLIQGGWSSEPDDLEKFLSMFGKNSQINSCDDSDDTDYIPSRNRQGKKNREVKRQRSDDSEGMTELQPPLKRLCRIDLSDVPYPPEIYAELVQHTLGQDSALSSLAVFIHKHLVTLKLRQLYADVEDYKGNKKVPKSNVLIIGPTGCGKTSSIMALAEYLKVPLVIGNATEWTPQGYIGSKWQQVFGQLYAAASNIASQDGKLASRAEIQKIAERGIVFIDEIDKLCGKDKNSKFFERVQQELLPVVQGTKVILDNKQVIDTTNILFIGGGAFPGILDLADKPVKGKEATLTPRILERYGMLPELAGRFGNIVQFSALNKAGLKQILTSAKGSFLQQYIDRYKWAYGIELTFTEEALDHIAEIAESQLTGARALNSMIEVIMKEYDFNIQSLMDQPLVVTKAVAVKSLKDFKPAEVVENKGYLSMYS